MKRRHFILGMIGLAATPYIGARASGNPSTIKK